jgi:hypothetical protein
MRSCNCDVRTILFTLAIPPMAALIDEFYDLDSGIYGKASVREPERSNREAFQDVSLLARYVKYML